MKSLFKFSLSILALSVLAACSSGGGASSSAASDDKHIVNSASTGGTNTGGTGTNSTASGGTNTGGMGTNSTASDGTNTGSTAPSGTDAGGTPPTTPTYSGIWSGSSHQPTLLVSNDKANEIVVNGVRLNLVDLAANRAPVGITDSYVQPGSHVTYGRFINQNDLDRDKNPRNYLFVYGNETAQDKMPTGGSFTYVGTATYGSEALAGYINDATSNVKVDFGANTVSGTISHTQRGINVTLPTATISGNSFSSRAGHEGDAFVSGKFYGAGASQLGGVFGDNGPSDFGGGYAGAFSATKQ